MTDASSIYQRARADVAAMLGYDLDNLTPEQATRLDVSTALRVLLDNQSARLCRGESLDARELLMASEALSRLLPPLREPVPDTNREDPRAYMWRTYLDSRRRGELAASMVASHLSPQQRLEAARAKVAEIEAELTAITPSEADITPPGEIGECYAGMRPGPDDPPRRSSQVIEGKAIPTPPAPATGILTDTQPEPWRGFVGGRPYDRWSDNRT
jgi:hypothetical protein